MPGAKRHTLPGSIWGQPCILGSPAWICFWPLWSQHGLIHALSGGNPQVIISIFFVSDTLSNMLLQRLQITHYRRLPMLDNVGHKTVICGPESFTPDSMPLFGETPEVERLLEIYQSQNIESLVFPNDHNRLSTLKFRFLVFVCFRGEWSLPQLCDELSWHTTLRRHGQWDVETFRWEQKQIQMQIHIYKNIQV